MPVDSKWIRQVPKERWPDFHTYLGHFNMPRVKKVEDLQDSLSYKAKPDDLIISTYPKNGTTWAQQIIYLIQHDAKSPSTAEEMRFNSVFLELLGRQAAESIVKPGCVKVHMPQHLTPWNDEAKYIIVVRNPKDVVVSYYYHAKGKPHFAFSNGTFDDFFDIFIADQAAWGDYFDFVNSWLAKKHLPNVFFITYEYMKANIKDAIRQMANFMDPELYGKKAETDPTFVDKIVEQSTFDFMKDFYGQNFNSRGEKEFQFFRKGQTNDWKSMLSSLRRNRYK